jgi:hypothetical protein
MPADNGGELLMLAVVFLGAVTLGDPLMLTNLAANLDRVPPVAPRIVRALAKECKPREGDDVVGGAVVSVLAVILFQLPAFLFVLPTTSFPIAYRLLGLAQLILAVPVFWYFWRLMRRA